MKKETVKQRVSRIATEYTNNKIDKKILTIELKALVLSAEIQTIKNFSITL